MAGTFHEQSHTESEPISDSTNEFCRHWALLQDRLVARGIVSPAEGRQPWEGSPVKNLLVGGPARESLPQSSAVHDALHIEGVAFHFRRKFPFETSEPVQIKS